MLIDLDFKKTNTDHHKKRRKRVEYKISVNNQKEIYDIGKVAKQAAGAVMLKIKNTVILATVSRDDNQVAENFFLLLFNISKKSYAVGKIPGGYIKQRTKQLILKL